jgi:hypothetical protein
VFYILATDVYHIQFIANFQFYKVTQWVKFLGVVAVVGYSADKLPNLYLIPSVERCSLVLGVVFCFVVVFFFKEKALYRTLSNE